jgi:hypothetical protein
MDETAARAQAIIDVANWRRDPFLRGGSRLSAPVVTAMRSVGDGDISGYIRALMPGYPSIAHALLRVAMQSVETAKLESWKAGSVESSRLDQEWA